MTVSTAHPAFRLTPQRSAVLEAVRRSDDHPTARDIYARVRRELPGIGFATVYRTLDLLRGHGHILELQLGDSPVARYDGNTGDHHHVVCAECGAIGDLDVVLPPSVTRDAERASGFEITAAELQFVGRCPDCRGLLSRDERVGSYGKRQSTGSAPRSDSRAFTWLNGREPKKP